MPDTGPRVRVNQVGYLPGGPKDATVVTDATERAALAAARGRRRGGGQRHDHPRGVDAASGQNVQTVDFSAYRTPGTGYTLTADGETSHPFDISGAVYDRLRADSLPFFYTQRSGIADRRRPVGAGYARPPATSASRPTRATPTCRASRASATTAWTCAAAGTTPATTASTWSTAASPSTSC